MTGQYFSAPPRTPYFNPALCPDCGAVLGPTRQDMSCETCGIVLHGTDADALSQTLVEADRLIGALRQTTLEQRRAQRAAHPAPFTPLTAPPPSFVPSPSVVAPPRRPLPVAGILLGLGALCLTVAGIVFVSIQWGTMSLSAKVLVMTLVTFALSGFAALVTSRGLRGSAEALWTVTLIDLAIDFFGAKHAGLGDLEHVSWPAYLSVAFALLSGVAVAVALWSVRTKVRLPLVSPQLFAGLLAPSSLANALDANNTTPWLFCSLVIVGAAAMSFALHEVRLPVASIPPLFAVGLAWLVLVLNGVDEAGRHGYAARLIHGHEPHLLAAVVLTFALAWVADRLRLRLAAAVAIAAFGVAAALGLGVSNDLLPNEVMLAPLVLLFAASAFGRPNVWITSARYVFAVLFAGATLAVLYNAIAALNAFEHLARPWQGHAGTRLTVEAATQRGTWAAVIMIIALVLASGAVAVIANVAFQRWGLVVAAVAPPVVAVTVLHAHPAVWVACVGFVVAGLCSAGAAYVARADEPLVDWLVATVALSSLGSHVLALQTPGLTLTIYTFAGLVSLVASRATGRPNVRMTLELVALAHVLAVGASLTRLTLPTFDLPLDVGLLSVAAVAGVVCVPSEQHRWWRWISAVAALIASWDFAAQAGHQVVEWYSLPLGTVALLFGISAARHSAMKFDSWLFYGPGLVVLTAPSLVVALDDPVSVRAGLVALWLAVLVGVGLAMNLRSPLVIGAVGGALLTVMEVWPYAVAVPRWILLAIAGIALLVIGTTWEDRRRNWTSAQRSLHSMR